MKKPMLPTLTFDRPQGSDWVYEIKYDGFRSLLFWYNDRIEIISRNGNRLNDQFPEIIRKCELNQKNVSSFLPFILDGELCILQSPYRASFEHIQQRGRLKNKAKIDAHAAEKPASFLAFDILLMKGLNISHLSLLERKERLKLLFTLNGFQPYVDIENDEELQLIGYEINYDAIWNKVTNYQSEGVIAKKKNSKWEEGKRTTNWLKIKNWQRGNFFIIGYEKNNGYFHVGVVRNQTIYHVGLFSHGLDQDERKALLHVIKENKIEESTEFVRISPSICVELLYLELYKEQLRQPIFSSFQFSLLWSDCRWELLLEETNSFQLPKEITISHPDKPLWKDKEINKKEYIEYLVQISPYMLPFLQHRLLTVIRYPHGMDGERFYQKNCPDYAPDFIKTAKEDGINYIVCNDIRTLTWLGNQLAFEFHIPFQSTASKGPSEIVFDLDPPSRSHFSLAIKAALLLKDVFDNLKLISFIKTSGNKGLQIYLPLPENTFTFDQTRRFTKFVATYLTSRQPDLFTIERLKKNRGNKLYIDYLQHAEGKTIIAPYSVRGNEGAFVATPLFWEEVTESLSIEQFPLEKIVARVKSNGCPFKNYFKAKESQQFKQVLQSLQSLMT